MGPFLLIDKSAIQSFSAAEVDVLHKHYSVIACPILINEIGANLLKHLNNPVLSQNKVAALSRKAGGFGGVAIHHHNTLCYANLLGTHISLWPQDRSFDRNERIDKHGREVALLEGTPERKALGRWISKEFNDDDLERAEKHFREFRNIDLEEIHKENVVMFPENAAVKSFAELVAFLDDPKRETPSGTWSIVEAITKVLQFSEADKGRVKDRWEKLGRPAMRLFSEYGHFFHRVDILFHIGLTAGLIRTSKRSKAIVDYQYLFYIPFAHVFCSGDLFHKEISKYLLRPGQEFILAADLKKDLKELADCHVNMNEQERKWYISHFGDRPPPVRGSLTGRYWETYMRPWEMGK